MDETQDTETQDTLDARLARVRAQESRRALRRREWRVLALFLIFALLCWLNVRRVEVRGESMYPTYHSGEMVVVWKTAPRSLLKPGDVIVFRQEKDELIKRIVYVQRAPGPARLPAQVELPNGVRVRLADLFSPYISPYFAQVRDGLLPPPPPQNTIYVLGDNLPVSDDSRYFGPISPQQILGKVIP